MKWNVYNTLVVETTFVVCCLCMVCLGIAGCTIGLRTNQQGRHFKTEMEDSTAILALSNIGVCSIAKKGYSFETSNKDCLAATEWWLTLLPGFMFPIDYHYNYDYNVRMFPGNITPDSVVQLEPDTNHLSDTISGFVIDSLTAKGYAVQKFYGSIDSVMQIKDVVLKAKEQGFDALFITTYIVWSKWAVPDHIDTIARTETTRFGFNGPTFSTIKKEPIMRFKSTTRNAIAPSAALIRTADGKILWKTYNYGLVQNAYLPNISNEPFNEVVAEAIIRNSNDSLVKAAANAMHILFKPKLWRGSFIPLPVKSGK